MLTEVITELDERDVRLYLTDVKGPVRDVLWRAGIWEQLDDRIFTCTNDAITAIQASRPAPDNKRRFGIDERSRNGHAPKVSAQ